MNRAADDLISRVAACDEIGKMIHEYREKGDHDLADALILVRRYVLKQLPAVDAAPVVYGQWKDNGNGTVSCNCCATWFPKIRESQLLFCGYCGAKMEKNNNE